MTGEFSVFVESGDEEVLEAVPLSTSFRDVFRPVAATCHGDEDFPSGLSTVMRGCDDACCSASCCCCFLRSLCEGLLADLVIAWSLIRCAERLMERFETLLDEACAIISRISNFDDGSFGDDHLAPEAKGDP